MANREAMPGLHDISETGRTAAHGPGFNIDASSCRIGGSSHLRG